MFLLIVLLRFKIRHKKSVEMKNYSGQPDSNFIINTNNQDCYIKKCIHLTNMMVINSRGFMTK